MRSHLARRERALGTSAFRSPPVVESTEADQADQRFLLKQSLLGPYARMWTGPRLITYIFDLATGRKFLATHESRLGAVNYDVRHLFPYGTLRLMEGEPHLAYRRLFVDAFRAVPVADHAVPIGAICDRAAHALLAAGEVPIGDVATSLRQYCIEMMLWLCFGLARTDPEFAEVMAIYREISTDRLIATFSPARFGRISELVTARPRPDHVSLMSHFAREDKLDATVLGNLVLLAEIGSYDLVGLWAWLVKLAAEHPQVLDEIQMMPDSVALSEATALEALRLERSEYILRAIKSEIVFDGLLFPARSHVKIAVWEAHKDPAKFPDPFRFDPHRFLGPRVSPDDYAPFGLDRHRCLGDGWVIGLSGALLRALAAIARLELIESGPALRQRFHFAPNPATRIRFASREGLESEASG